MKNHTFMDYLMYVCAALASGAFIGLAYRNESAGYAAAIWPAIASVWYYLYTINRK